MARQPVASAAANRDAEDSGGEAPDDGGPVLPEVGGAHPRSAGSDTAGAAGAAGDTDADGAGGGSSHDSDVAGAMDDDPFLAELRRAIEDPEPLGPRDDDAVWADGAQLYDQDITASGRFRRRRR